MVLAPVLFCLLVHWVNIIRFKYRSVLSRQCEMNLWYYRCSSLWYCPLPWATAFALDYCICPGIIPSPWTTVFAMGCCTSQGLNHCLCRVLLPLPYVMCCCLWPGLFLSNLQYSCLPTFLHLESGTNLNLQSDDWPKQSSNYALVALGNMECFTHHLRNDQWMTVKRRRRVHSVAIILCLGENCHAFERFLMHATPLYGPHSF